MNKLVELILIHIEQNLNKRDLEHALNEDLQPDDFAGGNIDDAYSAGFNHGYAYALQSIQNIIDDQDLTKDK